MYCGHCGAEMGAGARFCSQCGAPALAGYTAVGSRLAARLERPRANRVIAGVCAGMARQYRWDLTWVRVLAVLLALISSGAGAVAYLIFWIVMPEEPLMLPAPMTSAAPPTQPF